MIIIECEAISTYSLMFTASKVCMEESKTLASLIVTAPGYVRVSCENGDPGPHFTGSMGTPGPYFTGNMGTPPLPLTFNHAAAISSVKVLISQVYINKKVGKIIVPQTTIVYTDNYKLKIRF